MFKRLRAMVLISLRREMVFRLNFIFLFVGLPLKILISWLLWNFVIADNPSFSGMTRNQIIVFVAFTSFLSYLYDTNTTLQGVQRKLIYGGAVSDLTLPMDYHTMEIYSSWGTFILYGIIGFISLSAMFLFAGVTVILTPVKVILILAIIIANTYMQYFLVMIISSLAIFIGTVDSIQYSLLSGLQFFSGLLLPLAIFPEGARNVLYLNPLSGMIDLPASILVSDIIDYSLVGIRLGILLVWIIGLYFLNKKVWSISLEKFTAPGE